MRGQETKAKIKKDTVALNRQEIAYCRMNNGKGRTKKMFDKNGRYHGILSRQMTTVTEISMHVTYPNI